MMQVPSARTSGSFFENELAEENRQRLVCPGKKEGEQEFVE